MNTLCMVDRRVNHMKKKILAVVLGLTLCFGMTGCTKGDIEPENSDIEINI